MPAKLGTLGLLKINLFWNKGYDDIISVHDVTYKILSRDSNCIVEVVMYPKFGNFSMRKVAVSLWGKFGPKFGGNFSMKSIL